MRRCSHVTCTRRSSFNISGSEKPLQCKQHADDGIVNVRGKRCFQGFCTIRPAFNVVGIRTAVYYEQHALHGMSDSRIRCCSHESCTERWASIFFAPRLQRTVHTMQRMEWWTCVNSFAHTILAQNTRGSMPTAARRQLLQTTCR